ncbi:MAG: hypothetical protein HY657_19475 [Acidobacteria bacterium]|nr:hypothetical protein [Acidobacteriota bacterium]
MKRIVLFSAALLAFSAGVWAQGGRGAPAPAPPLEPGASQADVDKALLAGPANLRNQATVIKWNPANWTSTTLRKGTNRLLCFDKSGLPGQLPFSVECTSIANLDRVTQNMRFEAETDRDKRQAAVDAAEKDGTRAKPEFGSVWYHLQGQDQASARPHTTIAVPGATAQSLGLPDNGRQGGAWIMNAGTSTAHLMIPGH